MRFSVPRFSFGCPVFLFGCPVFLVLFGCPVFVGPVFAVGCPVFAALWLSRVRPERVLVALEMDKVPYGFKFVAGKAGDVLPALTARWLDEADKPAPY